MIADALQRIDAARTGDETTRRAPELADIPLGRYADPEFAAAEVSEVFGRSWSFIGHRSEWEAPGSYRVIDLPGGSIIVTRDASGRLHAVRNACRHRGAPVCREPAGRARRLTCRFHSWSYDLSGALVGVPCEADFGGLIREDRSLGSLWLDTWGDFLFVSFDAEAAPVAEELAPLIRRYSDVVCGPLRLAHRASHDLAVNWKVAIEAFLETYHIRTVHQQTAASITDTSAVANQLFGRGHSTSYVPWMPEVFEDEALGFIHAAMFPSDLAPIDGAPDFYRRNTTVFSIFPNVVCPIDDHGVLFLAFWPLAVDRTRFDLHWYGTDWGGRPRPEGWDLRVAGWDAIMAEDLVNMEPIQRSIGAAAHGGVPLSVGEHRIHHLHAEIDRRIGSDRIAAALRVAPVLDPLIEE